MIASDRFDIVLFAATDSPGGSTAEYLARRCIAEPFSFGLAGQNRAGLKRLARRLVSINPKMEGRIGIIVVDFSSSGSMRSLAESASIIVCPVSRSFHQHEQLANACLKAGTDLASDIADSRLISRLIDCTASKFNGAAGKSGRKFLVTCGFNSIPADFGVLHALHELSKGLSVGQRKAGEFEVEAFLDLPAGRSVNVPSSLLQSSLYKLAAMFSQVQTAAWLPPAFQAAATEAGRSTYPLLRFPGPRSEISGWACPISTIDAQVVLRSGASNAAYGKRFAYAQFLKVGGPLDLAAGGTLLSGLGLLAATETGRRILAKKRAEDSRTYKRGFSMMFSARYRQAGSISWTRRVLTRLDYDGSIGEGSALMLAESGLCLLHDREMLPDNEGVQTPANGLGLPMLRRLQRAGIKFSISERH